MKKIILSVAILATLLTACKKKDDPAPAAATTTSGTTTTGTTTTGTTTSGTTSGTTTSTTPTKTSMLIGKNWVMSAGIISPALIVNNPLDGTKVEISDLYKITNPVAALYSECIKDDILKMSATNTTNTNGDYTREVKSACNGEVDDSGTWKFNTDQTQIIFTSKTGSVTTNKVLELTANTLKVETPFTNPLDATDKKAYTATLTFTAK